MERAQNQSGSDCELACSMMALWGKGSLGESSRFHEGMLNSFVYIDSSTVDTIS